MHEEGKMHGTIGNDIRGELASPIIMLLNDMTKIKDVQNVDGK